MTYRKFINGQYIEMTEKEIAAINAECARFDAAERHRPLTEQEVAALLLKQQVNTIQVDDQTALRMAAFYPKWEDMVGKTANKENFKFTYSGKLYKTIAPNHTFQSNWIPGMGTESLYIRIEEDYSGSIYDPIPYEGNMELTQGLYYTQNGLVYLCIRNTGTAVHNPLSELIGIYLESAQ